MVLVPYVMVEDKQHPYFNVVYSKIQDPLNDLMERTYEVLQRSSLEKEYGTHGFIYRGIRYLGLVEPSRGPIPTLIGEVCLEFPPIHTEFLQILELKDRMFRALRQHGVYLPASKFMDGNLYPEHSPNINFYLKVQEEYHEYMGRFLILRGMK